MIKVGVTYRVCEPGDDEWFFAKVLRIEGEDDAVVEFHRPDVDKTFVEVLSFRGMNWALTSKQWLHEEVNHLPEDIFTI